jgi:hypothetical protein
MRDGVAIKIVVVVPGVNNMILKTENIEGSWSCSRDYSYWWSWSWGRSRGWNRSCSRGK